MTEADICREYRTAKAPGKQIQILADLNGTDRKSIMEILQRNGEKLDGRLVKRTKDTSSVACGDTFPSRGRLEAEDTAGRITEKAADQGDDTHTHTHTHGGRRSGFRPEGVYHGGRAYRAAA